MKRNEILLVLGVSLGQSGVYAVVDLLAKLTVTTRLSEQQVALNPPLSPRPWLDLTYRLLAIFFALVPALLALHLLNRDPGDSRGLLGMDRWRWRQDFGGGVALAALIGIPGLGLYFLGRALDLGVTLIPGQFAYWWSAPVLVLAAAENAFLEEIVVVGYLLTRLRELRWGVPAAIVASALLRGSYHLYQGYGAFFGNALMGVIFALVFLRWKRVFPLICAHTIIDVVAFVGYPLLAPHVSWL